MRRRELTATIVLYTYGQVTEHLYIPTLAHLVPCGGCLLAVLWHSKQA